MNSSDRSKMPQLLITLSLLTAIFWFLAQSVDVYFFTVTGAIFEILWLPMIILVYVLPIISLIFMIKEKFKLKSLSFYSFLILGATILYIVYRN